MQGKLFQRCTHLLYCSVLSLGGNVNTRRMSKPDMGSIFHIKKSMKYSGHMKLLCELSKWSNLMLLTSSDTKLPLMHLFLFTNSAQRKLVSLCTQSIHDRNKLSLPYILDKIQMWNIFWCLHIYDFSQFIITANSFHLFIHHTCDILRFQCQTKASW